MTLKRIVGWIIAGLVSFAITLGTLFAVAAFMAGLNPDGKAWPILLWGVFEWWVLLLLYRQTIDRKIMTNGRWAAK